MEIISDFSELSDILCEEIDMAFKSFKKFAMKIS